MPAYLTHQPLRSAKAVGIEYMAVGNSSEQTRVYNSTFTASDGSEYQGTVTMVYRVNEDLEPVGEIGFSIQIHGVQQAPVKINVPQGHPTGMTDGDVFAAFEPTDWNIDTVRAITLAPGMPQATRIDLPDTQTSGTTPVDGGWSPWGDWGECESGSDSDDDATYRIKRRTCTNPAPQHGGAPCTGNAERKEECAYIEVLGMELSKMQFYAGTVATVALVAVLLNNQSQRR
jgi:hypothetical protein